MKPLILGPQMLPPQVMVDLRQVLQSSQWKAGTDNTIRDEDIRGIWMSDVGSRERSTGNIQNNLVNVIQDVVKYADLDHAKEQYSWLALYKFQDSFPGTPSQAPTFTYRDLVGVTNLNLRADKYHIACMDIYDAKNPSKIAQIDCTGLLLYNNYIIVVDIFPLREYVKYLSTDDMLTIFKAIDENKATYQ